MDGSVGMHLAAGEVAPNHRYSFATAWEVTYGSDTACRPQGCSVPLLDAHPKSNAATTVRNSRTTKKLMSCFCLIKELIMLAGIYEYPASYFSLGWRSLSWEEQEQIMRAALTALEGLLMQEHGATQANCCSLHLPSQHSAWPTSAFPQRYSEVSHSRSSLTMSSLTKTQWGFRMYSASLQCWFIRIKTQSYMKREGRV